MAPCHSRHCSPHPDGSDITSLDVSLATVAGSPSGMPLGHGKGVDRDEMSGVKHQQHHECHEMSTPYSPESVESTLLNCCGVRLKRRKTHLAHRKESGCSKCDLPRQLQQQ
eukprot:scaffold4815_cov107-Cylindrotheca_fusiformis.AAC.5